MDDGVDVMRPVDPPGPGRRWACDQHFTEFADPETEELISIILNERKQ